MRNFILILAAGTALMTVAACKSKAVINDQAAMEATSDLGESDMDTATPEPEMSSTDLAMNDTPTGTSSTMDTPATTETSMPAPVESLGASSSGLGR